MTELATLIESMCQGTATNADRDRLEKLLRDPANRAEYLAASRLHSELLWRWHRGRFKVLGPRDAVGAPRRHAVKAGFPATDDKPRPSRGSAAAFAALVVGWLSQQAIALSKPVPMALTIAGGVVAGLLGVAAIVSVPPVGSGDAAVRWPDARITGVHDAKWRSREASFGFTDPLYAGTTLDLESGLVEIRYEGGATVLLEGPAKLRVEGRSAARLYRGRLTAKLEKTDQVDGAARRAGAELPRLFTIHTPKASVHDLGTEFGVDVREAGDADMHVFDGLVELVSVGGIASASDAATFRLAAGDAARIDEAGRITSTSGGQAKKFVRAMPKPERDPRSLLERLGWNDAAAEVIYRDPFTGSGQLAGTTPASRGGIGNAAWIAPPAGWALDPDRRMLVANTRSSAYLPFVVEPGHLYRMSITMDVVGQLDIPSDWFAFGFTAAANPAQLFDTVPAYAWIAQRFAQGGNFVFRGPATKGDGFETDRANGRQTRVIVLDASRPQWIVSFLLENKLIGQLRYSQPPTSIAYAGLCNIAVSHVCDFVMERSRR